MVCAELYDPPGRRDWLRWCACGAAVLGLHAAAVLALTHRSDPDPDAGAPVVTVDFSPVWAAPRSDPTELPPGPQQAEAEQVDQVRQENPVEHRETPPMVELPPGSTPVAVAVSHPAEVARDAPPTEAPRIPDRKAQEEIHQQATAAAAPPSAAAVDVRPAAPAPGSSRPATPAAVMTWQRQIAAQIKRHHRYPPNAHGLHGIATLSFTIDRQGRVVSRRIVHSAGSAVLDRDALALIMRAQPFPAPPPGIADDALSMAIPVDFLRADDP